MTSRSRTRIINKNKDTVISSIISWLDIDCISYNTTTYPAIYIDAENKDTQGVTFTYDDDSFESVGTGLDIRNELKVNVVNKMPS